MKWRKGKTAQRSNNNSEWAIGMVWECEDKKATGPDADNSYSDNNEDTRTSHSLGSIYIVCDISETFHSDLLCSWCVCSHTYIVWKCVERRQVSPIVYVENNIDNWMESNS